MPDGFHRADRVAVLVLGMHRSGTSALAGALARLGAATPKTVMQADQRNARGYTESLELVDLHDQLLASGGSSWRDWEPFDANWLRSPFAEQYGNVLRNLIADEFGDAPLFVVKDPRMCRVVPFWLAQLERLNVTPKAMLIVRNPADVAASMARRDTFPSRVAQLLWLRHVLDAELATQTVPRVFIHYEDLVRDWRDTINRASQALEIRWPNPIEAVERNIDAFLTPELQHHRGRTLEHLLAQSDVLDWVKTTYAILSDRDGLKSDDKAVREPLDRVRRNFDTACQAYHPLVSAEFRRALADLERLSSEAYFYKKETLRLRNRSVRGRLAAGAALLKKVKRRVRSALGRGSAPGPKAKQERPKGQAGKGAYPEGGPTSPMASYLASGAADRKIRTSSSHGADLAPATSQDNSTVTVTKHSARALIAIVCHVYYLSLWDELAEQTAQMAAPHDLFVTITEQPGASELAERIRLGKPNADVRIVANHGRDIFPFISILNSGRLDNYDLICKLHTKKSLHRKDGDFWRRKLLFGILGAPENVADILRGFNANPDLGLVVADGELYEGEKGWKGNRKRADELGNALGLRLDDYPVRFAFASIFWTRGTALKGLRRLALKAEDFEPEQNQVDATTAHAIERLFSILTMAEGLRVVERSRI